MKQLIEKLGFQLKQLPTETIEEFNIQSERKGELVLSDGRFATVFKLKVGHLLLARDPDDLSRMLKLLTVTVKLDGEPMTMKDAVNLELDDFNNLMSLLHKK